MPVKYISLVVLLTMMWTNPVYSEADVSDFDVLGLKLGMPIDDAKQILESAGYEIKTESSYGFQYIGRKGTPIRLREARTPGYVHASKKPQPYDSLYLQFTPGPDDGRIYAIFRDVRYHNVQSTSHENVVAAMEEKYGTPSFLASTKSGDRYLYGASWIFDGNRSKYNDTPVQTNNVSHEFKKTCGGPALVIGERKGIAGNRLYNSILQRNNSIKNKKALGLDKLEEISCAAYLLVNINSSSVQVSNFSVYLVDYGLWSETFGKVLAMAEEKISGSHTKAKEDARNVSVPNL